ncbi:heavy metal translocating P-type ATPase [Maribacter sp. 2307ULW6-5]|uniref:heavy metal translocating P-type ATPase n=1 Tax=Maribacter sp. 2307ULW6-5 TaxID=3386275 RepID=UPI0039BD2505
MEQTKCYHCGDDCAKKPIVHDEKSFCCNGCKMVYEIFASHDLSHYYELQQAAGATPKEIEGKYDFLDTDAIVERLTEFNDGSIQIVNLYVPHIHCSSCIWILENLNKLDPAITNSQVNFPKKTVRITYHLDKITLKELVLLLCRIGYEPYISLEDMGERATSVDRGLIYKLGVAGFAFGNVMFLSFPEYFDLNSSKDSGGEFWLNQYQDVFRWLMFAFSLPVVLYAARDYYTTAYKGLRTGILNMDVPIALGVTVLFVRSTLEIMFHWGPGFFDSLTGLIFFLLLGKFFQQKTYSFLSFERDYKSYFPIAVTVIGDEGETAVPAHEVKEGDRLLIRNEEIIPADGVLLSEAAQIDYSFVTGEAVPVQKNKGDKIFAGGRQINGSLEMETLKTVSQSYLTGLWSNSVFQEDKTTKFQAITDRIGKRFTLSVLTIAFTATFVWLFIDPSMALNVFTAVLIIACPCAIALASPFTLGNILRIFGKRKFYLKDAQTIERLAQIDMAIFDKTGTITTNQKSKAVYEGMPLTAAEESLMKSTLRASNHPLSRKLYELLAAHDIATLDEYQEHVGQGISGTKGKRNIRIGSGAFTGSSDTTDQLQTAVHISSNEGYKGSYVFQNQYREGIEKLFLELAGEMDTAVMSGDNAGEQERLGRLLPKGTQMLFNMKPEQKMHRIRNWQEEGKKVLMVGDGLNDAGALAQSDVGIAISEDINVFSPACDAILDASKFQFLKEYIQLSKKAIRIIKWSFVLSLAYNVVGIYFAVTGQLEPVIAAILMPLSSISIVAFTTIVSNYVSRKLP